EAAGTMEGPEAQTLMEAFGFIFSLRLDHQVEQLRRGQVPDDFIDPKTLNPLARSYLREAFRAVASVQANLSAELSLGVRWGCIAVNESVTLMGACCGATGPPLAETRML